MTKDMKTEVAAKINLDDMAKVDGGFNSSEDAWAAQRDCPRCGTMCSPFSVATHYGGFKADYRCNKCWCQFEAYNNSPDAFKITYQP